RQRQHPLADRLARQDIVHEQRGRLGQCPASPCRASLHCLDGVSVDASQSDAAGLNRDECRRFVADIRSVANMNFCIPGEKVIFYPTDRDKSHWPYRPHEVTIRDARAVKSELDLERNGFVLVERGSAVDNFYDAEEVERVYVPEVIALVK